MYVLNLPTNKLLEDELQKTLQGPPKTIYDSIINLYLGSYSVSYTIKNTPINTCEDVISHTLYNVGSYPQTNDTEYLAIYLRKLFISNKYVTYLGHRMNSSSNLVLYFLPTMTPHIDDGTISSQRPSASIDEFPVHIQFVELNGSINDHIDVLTTTLAGGEILSDHPMYELYVFYTCLTQAEKLIYVSSIEDTPRGVTVSCGSNHVPGLITTQQLIIPLSQQLTYLFNNLPEEELVNEIAFVSDLSDLYKFCIALIKFKLTYDEVSKLLYVYMKYKVNTIQTNLYNHFNENVLIDITQSVLHYIEGIMIHLPTTPYDITISYNQNRYLDLRIQTTE
jgi:hypothetical protein